MSKTYIALALRKRVADQAQHRCGYCLTKELIVGTLMEVDHIIPEALEGPTEEDNLWLACAQCNAHKNDRVAAFDIVTGQIVSLFDPRHQVWQDHFAWTHKGAQIIGLTATGRVTVETLQLNRVYLVEARQMWIAAGWHPPRD